MTDFIVGSPARDEDFLFRDDFVNELWEALAKHNVLLLAPRRTGKTSVMYRMLDYPKEDWLVIHKNVEDLKTPGEFVIELIDALNEHQPEYLRDCIAKMWDFMKGVIDKIQSIEAYELKIELRKSDELQKDWRGLASGLLERIMRSGEKVLFIIDELPDMLNNMRNTNTEDYDVFLHWYRKIRDKSLNTQLRWLVGGSVNLVASLDWDGKVKLINDLKSEILPPFSSEEVEKFVTSAFEVRGISFDAAVTQRVQTLLGTPVPLFLQMLTQEIYRHCKRLKLTMVTSDIVDEVFRKALLGEMARDKLQHYYSCIKLYYPANEQNATYEILSLLSKSDEGISRRTLYQHYQEIESRKSGVRTGHSLKQAFDRLLLYLQSDFYIEEITNGYYDFASFLLKTWWRKYYG